jgi:NADH-quinone oxidoreductase subunit N
MSLTDQLLDSLDSLSGFTAEAWLAFAFCVILVAELLLLRRGNVPRSRRWLSALTAGTLGMAAWLAWAEDVRGGLFQHLLVIDNQAVFFKMVVALAGFCVVLWETGTHTSVPHQRRQRLPTEWYAMLIGSVLGLFLLTMAVNLLAIYLSLELVSIASYLLAGLAADRRASEGGLKYLLFGAVSSAIMLYGMSLLYGMTGTLDITSTVFGIELAKNGAVALVALLLTTVGVLFKLSAVPFHIWTPDVYEAAPVPVAAFFSIGPKAAALLALMRLLQALPIGDVQTPLAVMALAGILIGNLSALRQTDAKRLLAYSGIAQAGFLLVGVVAMTETGFEAATFYAATYLFISLAAFFLIDALAPPMAPAQTLAGTFRIADFAGRYVVSPLLAVGLVVVALALTGLPPTVGFTAKLLTFTALFDAWQTTHNPWLGWLFGLGLANSVIALFYYLKIPFLLFFRPLAPNVPAEPVRLTVGQWVVLGITALPVVLLFFKPDWLLNWIIN